MLKSLGVSRSGYRTFLNRNVSPARQRKAAIKKHIQHIYDDSNRNYGAPKITRELRKSGECISQHTVGKYMREMGIKAQWIKPWTTTTRDSDFSKELHNIFDEQFNKDRLSTVISTIDKAKSSRDTDMPLIIHTDRGCQYVSEAWRQATEGMARSYSHTGYPYDNACIESFHSLIKREWYRHAYSMVFEYIETFYNTVRIHSHCDYMSPNDYEKLYMRVENLPVA